MQYNPGRDFRWLLLRPWVFIPRLLQVLWTLGGLVLVLLKDPGPLMWQLPSIMS